MEYIITLYQKVITALINNREVNRAEIEDALLVTSKRLDDAVINNFTTDEIERERDQIKWLLNNI